MGASIRVRELSAELGISNKELIQACRELDIEVKSHMSGLTEEEAEQVRERISEGPKTEEVVSRKEVQPGVIVRRRRKVVPRKEPEQAEEAPEEAEEPEEEPMETVGEEAAPAAEEAPVAEAEEELAPEPEAEETASEPEQAEEAPAAEEAAGEVEAEAPTEEAAAEAEPEQAPEAEETAEAAPEEETEEEEAEQAKPKKRKKSKRKDPDEGTQVKVISKPDPAEVAARAARAERTARQAPRPRSGAPRPGGPRPGGPRPGMPGAPGAPGGPPPAGDAASKKRRKKDRRVVDFTPHFEEEERRAALLRRQREEAAGMDRPRRARRKKARGAEEAASSASAKPIKATKRKIRMEEAIRLADLAHQMGVKAQALIKVLFGMGVMATINQSLDFDTATLVAEEFGYDIEKVGFSEEEFLLPKEEDKPEDLAPRAPVVTIMGHVDHGKTSLLDAIRKSDIIAGEAGGITQHIGAYDVETARGKVVFLDTPGHEAFTTMRKRGAQITDIVVLVVAADDGVMDQTREAIAHSKAAGVPIMVAVNKIDKEDADPDRVKRELAELDLVPEDWGGETIFANVSAKQRTGIDELLEVLLLQAEVMELKANPDKRGSGRIVEAKLDKGRGAVGTVLVQEGTLRQGDAFVCGTHSGRVRAMFNDMGKAVKEVGPSVPVEVQGFDGVPEAGDEFVVVEDDKVARRIAGERQIKVRELELAKESKVTLESFLSKRADSDLQVLDLVLKADVQGSLEAITEALNKLSTEQVRINVIHGAAGAITESDILLASASQAIIIGFNVRPTAKVKETAEAEDVEIRFYDIIYKLVDDVKQAMTGMLAPVISESYLGQAEVRETFSVPKVGTVAGCYVTDGKLTRNARARLLRDGVVIYTGKLSSLKRFKDDAKEVVKGYECGVGLENFNDVKVGDVIEAFEMVETAATLEGAAAAGKEKDKDAE